MLITSSDLADPKILYCNHSLERTSGHDAATLIGASPALLHGPNTKQTTLDRFIETLSHQREAQMTLGQQRKNGEEFTAEILAGYVELKDSDDGAYVSLTRETGNGVPPLPIDDIIEC